MWCENDKRDFLSTSGQITPERPVGQLLIKTIKEETLRNIVDIGTWNGLGSTQCFLIGLEENTSTEFISIESNMEKNLLAKKNLAHYLEKTPNAQLYWGTIIDKNDIVDAEIVFPELAQNSEFKRWHAIDIVNIKQAPYIFRYIPEEIDFVLFDGGEFTTYYEFLKLFPRCKKYIALDDVNCSKCKKIREFLIANPDWNEVAYIPERNGFSLFIRGTYGSPLTPPFTPTNI
jgi:hypothetical protein